MDSLYYSLPALILGVIALGLWGVVLWADCRPNRVLKPTTVSLTIKE